MPGFAVVGATGLTPSFVHAAGGMPHATDDTPNTSTLATATPEARHRRHRLSDEDRSFVERLVESRNLTQAARVLRLPRQTVASLLVPVGCVTEATIVLARERIAGLRAADAGQP